MIGNVSTLAGSAVPPSRVAIAPAAAASAAASTASPGPSVVVTLSGQEVAPPPATYAPPLLPAAPRGDTQTTATLTIRTASGKSVAFDIGGDGNEWTVAIRGGESLDDAERAAVTKLAGAFQDTLDGMASVPPKLDLGGLVGFDPKVFASVDFSTQVSRGTEAPTTFAFHADSASRSLRMTGAGGTIDIGVDTGTPAILGSAAQRAAALDNYMRQFGQAASRGHADPALMAMFKDAFGQLASIHDTTPGTVPMRSALSPAEHAVLTGMPDFHASLTQAGSSPNPLRPGEKDGFSYTVSQETQVKGTGPLDRGLSQHLHAQLSASFHSPLTPGGALMLTLDPKSQSYYYTRVDDVADSQADIAYDKGRLARASITRSASQTTDRSKYVMAKLVDETVTPYSRSDARELLGLLRSVEDDGSAPTRQRQAERERVLAEVQASVGLETDPSRLA